MRPRIHHILCTTLLILAGAAPADTLTLTNGDRLTGTATSKAGDKLVFQTTYAGTLKIHWADVAELVTDQPVAVLLNDDTELRAQRFAAAGGDDTVPVAGVSHINPPAAVTGKGIDFTGRVNLGLNQTSGNTDTQAYHLNAEAIGRSGDHRVTLATQYNQASDDGTESINNGTLSAKYDHFINKRWYAFGYTKFRRDKFKDLKLRREIGGGVGHQFYDRPERKLALEAGLTQVNEDYYQAPDDSGVSLRWAADYEQRIYRDLLTLFHRHELSWPVENVSDFLASAKTGVRVPIADGLTTTMEVDVDYDNEPSPGNKSTDWLYLLSLGYNW